jgi:hypothetical protein
MEYNIVSFAGDQNKIFLYPLRLTPPCCFAQLIFKPTQVSPWESWCSKGLQANKARIGDWVYPSGTPDQLDLGSCWWHHGFVKNQSQ